MWQEQGLDQQIVNHIETKLKLKEPTRVQTEVFRFLDTKTDIFAASRTGTGKTFAFVIPIIQKILQTKSEERDSMALVIAPTRELALQIKKEFNKFKNIGEKPLRICCLMGGLSKEKQLRILNKNWNVVVATVGRLKDLIDNENSIGLKKLALIRFMVVDEVDRLMELGQFEELKAILKFIDEGAVKSDELEIEHEINQNESKDLKNNNNDSKQNENLLQIDGSDSENIDLDVFQQNQISKDQNKSEKDSGKDKIKDEIEQELEALENFEDCQDIQEENKKSDSKNPKTSENMIDNVNFDPILDDALMINGELIQIEDELEEKFISKLNEEQLERANFAKKNRRTMLFSATLTQISSTSRMLSNKKLVNAMKSIRHNVQQKKLASAKEFPKIFDIMRQIRTNFKLEVINCTESTEDMFSQNLEFMRIKCLPQEKILHLYYLLNQPENQLSIVFCNSISSSRKVLNVLKYCGVNGYGLHSHMQQRQRLKKIEQFRKATKKVVLVSTDVASRGLHIDNVNLVVHYHTPRDFDTFVHRSGRTARMNLEGKVVLLEDAHDRKRFLKFKSDMGSKQINSIGNYN